LVIGENARPKVHKKLEEQVIAEAIQTKDATKKKKQIVIRQIKEVGPVASPNVSL
jgi:hypothetical protein